MTDIEPSLERSTEICRLGSALSKNPEHLLGSGDPCLASWQIAKLANHRLRVLHMVLYRCGLLWTVSYICKLCLKTHFKSQVPLKTYQNLSRLGSISVMSKLTSKNKKISICSFDFSRSDFKVLRNQICL